MRTFYIVKLKNDNPIFAVKSFKTWKVISILNGKAIRFLPLGLPNAPYNMIELRKNHIDSIEKYTNTGVTIMF